MESSENGNLKLNAFIIGATGATGRELTDLLLKSEYYATVSVLVRREIDRWQKLDENAKKKLNIIKCEDLGVLAGNKEEIASKLNLGDLKIDSVFCCLGSRVGRGEAEFRKVDFDFVVHSAELCEKFGIPHFSVVSSKGANPNSWFLYMKVKGQADEECLKKNVKRISIFRPGVILDRDNDDRLGEKIVQYVPFIDKIKSVDLAYSIMVNDVNIHKQLMKNENIKEPRRIIFHKEIENLKNNKI